MKNLLCLPLVFLSACADLGIAGPFEVADAPLATSSTVDYLGAAPITNAAACIALRLPGRWHCEPVLNGWADASRPLTQTGAWCVDKSDNDRTFSVGGLWEPDRQTGWIDGWVDETLYGDFVLVDEQTTAEYSFEYGPLPSATCELETRTWAVAL